jgi:uncharacterized membrane protein
VRRYRLPHPWLAAAWAAAAVYAVVLSAASIVKHDHFRSGGYDLGIFGQAAWLMSHGHKPFSTIRGRDLFADHFQPALVLLAPLGRLPLPSALLVFQATVLAAAGPLLYVLARERGARQELSFAVALLWVASPLTQWANLFDYHPETSVPALLMLGAVLLERERVAWFLGTALLASAIKEDVCLVYLMWGLVIASWGRRRLGFGLAAAAAIWFVVAIEVAIPALGGNLSFYSARFAGTRGETVRDVLLRLVEHPVWSFEHYATRTNGHIIIVLVACTGGLCLLAPRLLALALPPVAANVLSAYNYQHDLHFQYQLVPAAACSIAAAYGAGFLTEHLNRRIAAAAAAVLIVGAVGVTALDAPAIKELRRKAPPADAAKIRALDLIPSSAVVAAAPDLVPHLALRRRIYQLPEPFQLYRYNGEYWSSAELRRREAMVEYVIYDGSHLDPTPARQMAVLRRRLPELGFTIVYSRDGVVLQRRG